MDKLTVGGWIFMIASWTAILALNIYCFVCIFRDKKKNIVDTQDIESELDALKK